MRRLAACAPYIGRVSNRSGGELDRQNAQVGATKETTMSERLNLTPTEAVTIRSSTPEALEVEAEYAPNGDPPPRHWHPAQDEHFRVLEGTLRARVDGIERELGAGDEIEIPREAIHQMWNPGSTPTRAIWRTSP